MADVDISGIDKVILLRTLWNIVEPAEFFKHMNMDPPSFDEENAQEAVKKYIDYFCGRCIQMPSIIITEKQYLRK